VIGADLRSLRLTGCTGTASYTYAGTALTGYGQRSPRKAGTSCLPTRARSRRKLP